MAFRFGDENSGTATNVVLTMPSDVAVGDLVVCLGSVEDENDLALTFTSGGTSTTSAWTEPAGLDIVNAGDFFTQEVAYARVTGAGTLTVTIAGGGSFWRGGIGGVWDEMPDPLVLEDSAYERVSSASDDISGASVTPTTTDSMAICFAHHWTTGGGTTGPLARLSWTDGVEGVNYTTGDDLGAVIYQARTNTTAITGDVTVPGSGTRITHMSSLVFSEEAAAGGGELLLLNSSNSGGF